MLYFFKGRRFFPSEEEKKSHCLIINVLVGLHTRVESVSCPFYIMQHKNPPEKKKEIRQKCMSELAQFFHIKLSRIVSTKMKFSLRLKKIPETETHTIPSYTPPVLLIMPSLHSNMSHRDGMALKYSRGKISSAVFTFFFGAKKKHISCEDFCVISNLNFVLTRMKHLKLLSTFS
jgi:hypothetical protein